MDVNESRAKQAAPNVEIRFIKEKESAEADQRECQPSHKATADEQSDDDLLVDEKQTRTTALCLHSRMIVSQIV